MTAPFNGQRVRIGGVLYIVRGYDSLTNAAQVESVDGFIAEVDASSFDPEGPTYRAADSLILPPPPAPPPAPIPCATCGDLTTAIGMQFCNDCYEVQRRIGAYVTRGGEKARAVILRALGFVKRPGLTDKKDIII